eukprot:10409762-Alexandrium_andersonii.AAC.1
MSCTCSCTHASGPCVGALCAHVMDMLMHTCEWACASYAHANIVMQVRRRPGNRHRECGPQQGSEKLSLIHI